MLYAIWYHLYNLKNIHRGVLLLVKLQAEVSIGVAGGTDINPLKHNVENWPNKLKNLAVFTLQDSSVSNSLKKGNLTLSFLLLDLALA